MGFPFELGGIPYYGYGKTIASVPSFIHAQLSGTDAAKSLWFPVTVINAPSSAMSMVQLKDTVANYSQIDDVWTEEFLRGWSISPSPRQLRRSRLSV